MAHQSLYRRYRPRKFAELKGQEHVVAALRNAVAEDSAAHAYMFSGPRGTGKTSTARIFAKALNCTSLQGGEPCCECDSCLAMEAGNSFDLFELDAASNNGVEAIRDLVERTMVVSPGRTKVYILDEVHMLSKGASNALLKTLEEPPEHVRFVLATTDPQKVLPTIRSRTQHFEFRLLSVEELTDHAQWVSADAGLQVDEASIAYAVKHGRGSVRDMLSALEQVVAAGGVFERREPVDELFSALAVGTPGPALVAVADAIADGHDPRVLAEAFVAEVREAFLLSIGVDTPQIVDTDRVRLSAWAEKLGSASLSKALERIGSALVDMRSAADPRVPLEVALIQLTPSSPAPQSVSHKGTQDSLGTRSGDDSALSASTVELADLRSRVERLEATLAESQAPSAPVRKSATGSGAGDEDPPSGRPAQRARASAGGERAAEPAAAPTQTGRAKPPPPPPRRSRLGAPTDTRTTARRAAEPEGTATGGPPAHPPPGKSDGEAPGPASVTKRSGAAVPDRDSLVVAFGDSVVPQLKGIAKAIYSNGRFVSVVGDHAVFAVENAPTRDRAERYRAEVESLLAAEFSTPVPLRLIVEGEEGDASRSEPRMAADPGGSPQAPAGPGSQGAPLAAPRGRPSRTAEPGDRSQAGESSREATGGGVTRDGTGDTGPEVGTARSGVVGSGSSSDASDDEAEIMAQVSELEDADVQTSTVDRLTAAFPGAELIESEETT